MSEKPILFNTAMVQEIMAGDKTCTRRLIKNKYSNTDIEWFENKYGRRLVYMQNDAPTDIIHENGSRTCHVKACEEIKAPYEIGDILYVRETWRVWDSDICTCYECHGCNHGKYIYKAGYGDDEELKWKPSIHMPKEAARIFLRVTAVKVERLQDITTEGCFKEGITFDYNSPNTEFDFFEELWDSTIKKEDIEAHGYKANPWVWVIDFEVVSKNPITGEWKKVFRRVD